MIYNEYKDFDDLFYNLNREVIIHPDNYVEGLDLCSAYLPFSVLEINSSNCSINLGELWYKKNKFNNLVNTYIDLGKLYEYKEKLKRCSGSSLTFYFKQEKPQRGNKENNGPCLISLVLTRSLRSSKFNELNVYYRTCELGRRFAADLVLLHIFIKELPEICDIKKIRLIISKPYFSTMTAMGLLKNLNIKEEDLNEENKIHKGILNQLKIVKSGKLSNFKSRRLVQEQVLGINEKEDININELSILGGTIFE